MSLWTVGSRFSLSLARVRTRPPSTRIFIFWLPSVCLCAWDVISFFFFFLLHSFVGVLWTSQQHPLCYVVWCDREQYMSIEYETNCSCNKWSLCLWDSSARTNNVTQRRRRKKCRKINAKKVTRAGRSPITNSASAKNSAPCAVATHFGQINVLSISHRVRL